MALIDYAKESFSSGEVSSRLAMRQNIDRYKNGATLLENWAVLLQGGVTRRAGFRYVATVKDSTKLTLVRPFEASTTDAYILEMGHLYLRFYKNGAQLESSPGVPVEVVTPYTEAQLRLVRTAQANDVMILTHPAHAPRRLSRLSDTSWVFSTIPLRPPPTFEAGHVGGTGLTLSATTGTITVTAAAGFFLPGDVQRQLVSGVGRALILSYTSSTVVSAGVIDAFAGTSLSAGAWSLTGSPVADLVPSAMQPAGREVTLTLGLTQPGAGELVAHGSFDSGLTGWSDFSHPELVSSTHNGGNNSAFVLHDSTTDFFLAGVQPTQLVNNTTDGSQGTVASVGDGLCLIADPGLVGGTDNDFDTNDAYTIQATGYVSVSGGVATLNGGTAGYGWIEQSITTVAGTSYALTFRVTGASLTAMVGSASGGSDLYTEASFVPGTHTLTFVAADTGTHIGFRNTQNQSAGVTQVSCKIFSIAGFREADMGKYVRVHDGLVLLSTFVSSSSVKGELLRELSSTATAPAGAWTLESPSWDATLGWPGVVVLYEGRLYFAGSARFPQTIWGSAIDDFFNFAVGVLPSDAIELSLVDSGGNITLNLIRWLMPAENLLVGTTHGEYRLAGSGDDPISATTPPRNRIQSTFGSDTVQPLKVGSALLFAQRQGSKLREMAYDAQTQQAFVARDITITSDHLLRTARVVELAYQQEPTSTVWAVRSDGVLLGLTYDLSEQVLAWYRVVTNGAVESVATIPHPTGNAHQVWMTVFRDVNGVAKRFIEVQMPEAVMTLPEAVTQLNELTGETETISSWTGLTVDAAVVYSGAPTTTIAVAHLIGEEVAIVADGAVLPSQVVPGSGNLTLPQAASSVFAGLFYGCRGRALPVDLPVRGTTGQGLRKRFASLTGRVEKTACLVLNGERVPFRQASMPMNQGPVPVSGDKEVTPLGWDTMGCIDFVVDQPLPCTIIGLYGTVDQEVHA